MGILVKGETHQLIELLLSTSDLSNKHSADLWLDGNRLFHRTKISPLNARSLSLHGSHLVFARKWLVLTRNFLCGSTAIRCPYTEKMLSFRGSLKSFISMRCLFFGEIMRTYVCKYIYSFLLTTTKAKRLSLHGNEIVQKIKLCCGLTEVGVAHAK